MKCGRSWIAGTLACLWGLWFLAAVGISKEAGEKELREGVRKLAEVIAQKDTDTAKKQAAELAKKIDKIEELMLLFSVRNGDEGGLGIGPKPGTIQPDGIEQKLEFLAKKPLPEKQLAAEAEDLARMGYQVAAVTQVAHAKPPEKDEEGKTRKNWLLFAEQAHAAALEFAATVKKKDPDTVQKAAKKLDAQCSRCHDVFK